MYKTPEEVNNSVSDYQENYVTGWIKMYRSLKNHWIIDNAEYFKAWFLVLCEVNHKGNKVLIKGELYDCKKGQSVKSLDSWRKVFGTGWTVQKVRTFFSLLEKDQMVNTQGTNKTTRLTVCNYDTYQGGQQANNTQNNNQTTSTQQSNNKHSTTNKNEKNYKNEEEEENNSSGFIEKFTPWILDKPHKNTISKLKLFMEKFRVENSSSLKKLFEQFVEDKKIEGAMFNNLQHVLNSFNLWLENPKNYVKPESFEEAQKRKQLDASRF